MVTSVHTAVFSKQGVSTYLAVCFCVVSLWSCPKDTTSLPWPLDDCSSSFASQHHKCFGFMFLIGIIQSKMTSGDEHSEMSGNSYLADQLVALPPPQYWHLVVKNGNFTFLLLELILADQVADLSPPPREAQMRCSMQKTFTMRVLSTYSFTWHSSPWRKVQQVYGSGNILGPCAVFFSDGVWLFGTSGQVSLCNPAVAASESLGKEQWYILDFHVMCCLHVYLSLS